MPPRWYTYAIASLALQLKTAAWGLCRHRGPDDDSEPCDDCVLKVCGDAADKLKQSLTPQPENANDSGPEELC